MKLSDPLNASDCPTNYYPCTPNCAMHIKLDQSGTFQRAHDGRGESKEKITAEGGEAELDYEDKGYVMVVKPPRVSLL